MRLVRNSGSVLKEAPQFPGRAEGELQWQTADVSLLRAAEQKVEDRGQICFSRGSVVRRASSFMCVCREGESVRRERDTHRCTERCGSPKILRRSIPAKVERVLRGVQLFVDVVLDSRIVESQCIRQGSNEKRETNAPILSFVLHSSFELCVVLFCFLCYINRVI